MTQEQKIRLIEFEYGLLSDMNTLSEFNDEITSKLENRQLINAMHKLSETILLIQKLTEL